MNNTVGELKILSWQHYSSGVFLGLTFFSISALNILFLKCFYNLRQQAFVRNSIAIISVIATDLVNAILLTPTLFFWFLLPPPNTYTSCLVKSLPFMLSNYTSLLNMTCFCVYRFIITKNVSMGKIQVHCSKYSLATIGVWGTALIVISIPYIVWNNSNRIILDCRRSLFSNVNSALGMYSLLFDIPFILMNVVVFILVILFKKTHARVFADPISELHTDIPLTTENGQPENSGTCTFVKANLKPVSQAATKIEKLCEGSRLEEQIFDDSSSSTSNPEMIQMNVKQRTRSESSNNLATVSHGDLKLNNKFTSTFNASPVTLQEYKVPTSNLFEKQTKGINDGRGHCEAVQESITELHPRGNNNKPRKCDGSGQLILELKPCE